MSRVPGEPYGIGTRSRNSSDRRHRTASIGRGVLGVLELGAPEAEASGVAHFGVRLGYRDFLAILMAEEVVPRARTRIQRRVRRAHFPSILTSR